MARTKALAIVAGAALAGIAGTLIARSMRPLGARNAGASVPYGKGARIEKVFTIAAPANELYDHWRDLRNLPATLSHIESVQIIDDLRSRWSATGPAGFTASWDAEIIDDQPGKRIAWRSLGGSVPNAGSVSFKPATGGRGTELRVEMEWQPPAGALGKSFLDLIGGDPGLIVETDLRRFKSRIEGGTVAVNGTDVKA
jgi:uncharacterized membrane protein